MATIFKGESMRKIIVSKNDQADFSSIQDAVDLAVKRNEPAKIIIKNGIYNEYLKIYGDNIHLVGEEKVTITGDLSANDINEQGIPLGTFQTGTVFINGAGNQLENLTIENTAGPTAGQAVALYIEGTDTKVTSCIIDGCQDTICFGPLPDHNKDGTVMFSPWRKLKFEQQNTLFSSCTVKGTVDFLFGGGSVLLFDCLIQVKERTTTNIITAASTKPNQNGFHFINCRIEGESPYLLGRPWRSNAKTRFEKCTFDEFLLKDGWDDWNKPEAHETVSYEEIECAYKEMPQRPEWIHLKGAKIDAS